MRPVSLLISLCFMQTVSHASESRVSFSAEDIAVLKSMVKKEHISSSAEKLMVSAPVWDLLASPNPVEVFITLSSSDWGAALTGAAKLRKVTSCAIAKDISYHLNRTLSERVPTGGALAYFEKMQKIYDDACG